MNTPAKANGQSEERASTPQSLLASAPRGSMPFTMVRGRLADVWRHRPAPRRKPGMWQVRDGYNDMVADVYLGEAVARRIAALPRLVHALTALTLAGQSCHAQEEALAEAQAILREVAV